jgi:hypothetical protein
MVSVKSSFLSLKTLCVKDFDIVKFQNFVYRRVFHPSICILFISHFTSSKKHTGKLETWPQKNSTYFSGINFQVQRFSETVSENWSTGGPFVVLIEMSCPHRGTLLSDGTVNVVPQEFRPFVSLTLWSTNLFLQCLDTVNHTLIGRNGTTCSLVLGFCN